MKYPSLGLRTLLTLAFVAAGAAKLAGVDMMVQTFDAVGLGQWLRYVTGAIEIGGALALWWPNRQVVGAGLLGATMVGAVLSHVFVLGVATAMPSIVLGLMCAAVLYLHRDQIKDYLP